MIEDSPEGHRSSVLRDGDAFFEDFETWSTRLALEELLDEALEDEELARALRQEELRADDAREAVLTSVSALARVRMERDHAWNLVERPSRAVTLAEIGWLTVAGVMLVGYFSVLQLAWSAMPGFFQIFAVIGLVSVIVLSAGMIVRRTPRLFLREVRRRAREMPHPDLIGLGDRREFALREIVMPELREYIGKNRRTFHGTSLVFGEPDSRADDLERNLVRTAAVKRLRRIVDRAESVAVALAGHRGTGKSTAIRSLERGLLTGETQTAPLVVVATAPAAYEARDFVLHLHALLCKAVIGKVALKLDTAPAGRKRAVRRALRRTAAFIVLAGVVAVVVWALWGGRPAEAATQLGAAVSDLVTGSVSPPRLWEGQSIRRLLAIGLALLAALRVAVGLIEAGVAGFRWVVRRRRGGSLLDLMRLAERQLDRIRFLQTYTTGWSGKLSMPLKGEAGRTWSTQRAEQQLTHPEVVEKFREFAEEAAWGLDVHRLAGRVVIAIDELDKIGEPEKAHHFINDVKGVFDVPGCLFFVSVSDDAVLGFEQRGLGVRDAFDSAFTEMVRLEPFTLDESRLWIALRLRGISEQFCYLGHCLSGGLPRDLKRCVVDMVDLTNELYQPSLEVVTRSLVTAEMAGKTRAFTTTAATLERSPELIALTTELLRIPDTETPMELAELADRLVREDAESAAAPISELRWHSGCFVLFCATMLDVFDDDLTGARLGPELHRLAVVRRQMAMHPRQAWEDLVEFRKAKSLSE